jgi:hypothetical protein
MFVYLRQTLCQKKISFLSEIILSRLSDGNRIMPLLKELGCRDPFLNHLYKIDKRFTICL